MLLTPVVVESESIYNTPPVVNPSADILIPIPVVSGLAFQSRIVAVVCSASIVHGVSSISSKLKCTPAFAYVEFCVTENLAPAAADPILIESSPPSTTNKLTSSSPSILKS